MYASFSFWHDLPPLWTSKSPGSPCFSLQWKPGLCVVLVLLVQLPSRVFSRSSFNQLRLFLIVDLAELLLIRHVSRARIAESEYFLANGNSKLIQERFALQRGRFSR